LSSVGQILEDIVVTSKLNTGGCDDNAHRAEVLRKSDVVNKKDDNAIRLEELRKNEQDHDDDARRCAGELLEDTVIEEAEETLVVSKTTINNTLEDTTEDTVEETTEDTVL